MDAAYLQSAVGEPLKEALTNMVVVQPDDAVEFIGTYLLEYAKKHEGEAARKARFEFLESAVAEQDAARAEAEALTAARAKAEGPSDEELILEAELAEAADVAVLYPRVLAAVKRQAGATAAYIGAKGATTAGVPVIAWTCATEGCSVAGGTLSGAPPESEEADEGLTFDLFKQRDAYEAEAEAADEKVAEATARVDAAAAGGENAPDAEAAARAKAEAVTARAAVPRFPAMVAVPNVVREPRVKFYGIPLVGSYCAVAVRYESALHAGGVGEPVPMPAAPTEPETPAAEEPAADAPADEPAASNEPEATAEENVAPEEPEAPPVREPKAQPVLLPVEKVLAVHTMGIARPLAVAKMDVVAAWANKLAIAHARADAAAWTASALLREDAKEAVAGLKEAAAVAGAEEEAKMEALLASHADAEEPLPEDAKALAVATLRAASALTLLQIYLPALDALAKDKIPPPLAAIPLLQTALELAGVAPVLCAAPGTGLPDWGLIAAALGQTLAQALATRDFAAALTADADDSTAAAADVAALKEALDATDSAALEDFYAADFFARLVDWMKQLFALHDLVKTQAQAAADAAAEADAS